MKQTGIMATTQVDLQFQRFTRAALVDLAARINSGARPCLTIEHDPTLPPFGKIIKAWVEIRDDGEYQLVAEREIFEKSSWAELKDGTKIFRQESETDISPFADRYEALPLGSVICYDPTNFESKEVFDSFVQEIRTDSGEDFSTTVFGRKSFIPDPEVIVRITETVAKYLIASKVLQKAGDKVIDFGCRRYCEVLRFYQIPCHLCHKIHQSKR